MGSPTKTTVKKLFALSGNSCAFPKCETPVIDASKNVMGEICHIKARKPDGPRFDSNQSEKERHAYENLILMCSTHHKVIDTDIESYTVERLHQIKKKHESSQEKEVEISQLGVQLLIANIEEIVVKQGSVIFSQHQMGGQIAHSITNIGKQPRQIILTAKDELRKRLERHPPADFEIQAIMGDSESFQLALALADILQSLGWKKKSGVNLVVLSGPVFGIQLIAPSHTAHVRILGEWLIQVGLRAEGLRDSNLDGLIIRVGSA